MLKAFITGISGFTGRYLAAELIKSGYKVFGLAQTQQVTAIQDVDEIYVADLLDTEGLVSIIQEIQPDVVVHLAAIAFVAHGEIDAIYRTNVLGTRSLLEVLVQTGLSFRSVLLASSANVYGNASGILTEITPPAPTNDYAVSKLAMEYVAKLYMDRLPLIIARPFNYTGVGQSEKFLLPKIVNHIRNHAEIIELGNLDVARDFSDVRDVVKCYCLLLENASAIGETFNVCSGKSYTLMEILDMVKSISGHNIEIRINPNFVRKNEVKFLAGNCSKLNSLVGNIDNIPFTQTLQWMIEA